MNIKTMNRHELTELPSAGVVNQKYERLMLGLNRSGCMPVKGLSKAKENEN